ncbi:transcription factor LRL2-like isoform X1 [Zingiber officinale]|uniref:transcription factor LRL2-like isoform X1 n=1 Tax=Zingiber officinale TaxID=94328 RepID=UPI001C4CBB33|nr:transcription factor LRL2-like isoform X1 [Zingiber officinale]XP_042378720.1 transcription factor LRL2-like isoform X1 [Zingiber officinale]
MEEGSNEALWSLAKLNDFRSSSMFNLPNQTRPAPDQFVGSGTCPFSQIFLSSEVHCMQIYSNLANQLYAPSPRPLYVVPPVDVPKGDVLPISRMDAAKTYYSFGSCNTLCHSKFSTNPPLNQLGNSSISGISSSAVNWPSPIISNMDGESASNFDKTLSLVQNAEASMSAIVPLSKASTEEDSGGGENAIETHSKEKAHSTEARARAATNSRLRKARIAEGIKALQDSLPFSDQDTNESVLDDVIDYIKFLKLQLKVLSQNKLNGEAEKYPFVYVEGYGHYLLHENLSGEPLEEMMGHLIESNMPASLDLLGSKGLVVLPTVLANSLPQMD